MTPLAEPRAPVAAWPAVYPATEQPAGGQKPSVASSLSPQFIAPIPAPTDPPRGDREPPSDQPDRQVEEVEVPAESVIGLELETSLSTESARVEDRVDARVTRDVRVGGRIAVRAGSRVIGSVASVDRGGRVRERARIGIRFMTLVMPDASRVAIHTETVYRDGDSPVDGASAKIGGAAIGGAVLGAILGGGKGAAIGSGIGAASGTAAAMAGERRPALLLAGTTISVRTQSPFTVRVDK